MSNKTSVTVFGASGFIGQEICRYFSSREDYRVVAVSRKSQVNFIGETIDIDSPELDRVLANTDVVINLSGANIADQAWTEARKKELWESRIMTTRRIKERWITALVGQGRSKGKKILLVNASAVGYYGREDEDSPPDENDIKTEASEKGSGFLSDLTRDWEMEATFTPAEGASLTELGIQSRSVQLRFGLVLGKEGGALPQIFRATRWFLGAVVGSGDQLVSWVAVKEVSDIIAFLIHKDISGPVNLTAPQTVTFRQFARHIGKHLRRPVWVRVPGFVLKKTMKERADLLLKGDRVYPEKLIEAGYVFKYPNLPLALKEMEEREETEKK